MFTEHANKLVEVANLACSMSANEDGVKMVRYAAQQIQNLCPQVGSKNIWINPKIILTTAAGDQRCSRVGEPATEQGGPGQHGRVPQRVGEPGADTDLSLVSTLNDEL